MTIFLEMIGAWVGLSCTLGPLLTWLVFRGKRARRAARHHWIATHPNTPWDQMPAAISGIPEPQLGETIPVQLR